VSGVYGGSGDEGFTGFRKVVDFGPLWSFRMSRISSGSVGS
jgi:hypothetical protein